MKQPDTISNQPPPLASMRFDALLRQGIETCQRLGGDVWTDYNEHDPGVTILEQLCFAITELGFRANYPILELLAPSLTAALANQQAQLATGAQATPDSNAPPPEQIDTQTFITGDRILSSAPIAIDDYRKLLYDRVHNLKNAWLERVPVEAQSEHADGMLSVQIETFDEELQLGSHDADAMQADLAQVQNAVSLLLHDNRNLGEDFAEIRILDPCEFTVSAIVTLNDDADPVAVLAQLLFNIQFQLVPFPRVTPVGPRMERGIPPDQLYVGPTLKMGLIETRVSQGFLDDSGLSSKCKQVTTDALYQIMLAVDGVQGVCDVLIDGKTDPLNIDPHSVPRLTPWILANLPSNTEFSIALTRNDMRVAVDSNLVTQQIARLYAEVKKGEVFSQEQVENASYVKLPTPDSGAGRDISSYYSVQHHFPATYGIGRFGGLAGSTGGSSAMRKRQAQKHQLQAYLLFFEQLMANGAVQLADAWRLFELEQDLERSYFCQPVVRSAAGGATEPPDMLPVLPDPPVPTPTPERVSYIVYINASESHAEILLRSREFSSMLEARTMLKTILEAAANAQRYRIFALPSGKFELIVEDQRGQSLAFASVHFDFDHEARREIARIVTFLYAIHRDGPELARRVVIEAKGVYGFKLLDDEGKTILSATHLTLEKQKEQVSALLECGLSDLHYRVRPLGNGDFMLVLHGHDKDEIAQGEQRFSSLHQARHGIEAAIDIVARLRRHPSLQNQYLLLFPTEPGAAKGKLDKLGYHEQQLNELVEEFDDFPERRNRFLNHLLARFGESFNDTALEQFDPAPNADRDAFLRDLIKWKIAFLQQIVEFGNKRNCGANISKAGPQRSILERRLACLLGLPTALPTADVAPIVGFEYRTNQTATPAVDERRFLFVSQWPDVAQALLRHGVHEENYQIVQHAGHANLVFSWPNQPEGTREIYRAARKSQVEEARDNLIAMLAAYANDRARLYAGEELQLQEHILLLPQAEKTPNDEELNQPPSASTPPEKNKSRHGKRGIHIEWNRHGWKLIDERLTRAELFRLARMPGKLRIIVIKGAHQYDEKSVLALHDRNNNVVAHSGQYETHHHAMAGMRGFLAFVNRSMREAIRPVTQAARNPQGKQAAARANSSISPPVSASPTASIPPNSTPDDFFSYRISVVLPNWPIRMQNAEFRRFVQETVDENCPAHLSAQCLWLDRAEMKVFKDLRDKWASLRCAYIADPQADPASLNTASAAFRTFLQGRIAKANAAYNTDPPDQVNTNAATP